MEGSLRFQLDRKGINYIGMDLSPDYFDKQFIREQGIPTKKIYPEITGIVGDASKAPIKSNSIEMAVCADVLEHTSDPLTALKEIFRITKPEGTVLIVAPSLYKLDTANYEHIREKRKSSHQVKMTIDEWISMCEESGFSVDVKNSFPFCIASGLSYLTWINEQFVPERKDLLDTEIPTPSDIFHKQIRNIFAKHSETIDSKIRADGVEQALLEDIKRGDIKSVFQILNKAVLSIVSSKEEPLIQNFFNDITSTSYAPDRIAQIQKIFADSKYPSLLLGSSVLLVLKKNKE